DDEAVKFNGSIFFASGGAQFFPGKPISASITDRKTTDDVNSDGSDNTEALRAELTFTDGKVDALLFKVDTLKFKLGSVLELNAKDFMLNTGASDSEELVSFASLGATLNISGLRLSGEARNFAFLGDGSFKAKAGFGVFIGVGGADGSSFKWPKWLPIKINAIGIEWDDIENSPEDFVITLSASVTGLRGVAGLEFSGIVEGVKIDPQLLLEGKFPIIDIQSLGVTVRGKLFGGDLDATLLGGILKLDANGNQISATDTTTAVADRVFFLGVDGGFKINGMGLKIQFGLSELGPLNVQLTINARVPLPFGFEISEFNGGIEFYKSLPAIDSPFELRNPAFNLSGETDPTLWLSTLKEQVVTQFKLLKANPSLSGFEAAFTSPMIIRAGIRFSHMALSQDVFNAQGEIMISTDGKFLIAAKLNFQEDKLSISAKLYADLSKVADGDVVMLFLADIPDQFRLLTIYGSLKMGFRGSGGEEVTFDFSQSPLTTSSDAKPEAMLVDPMAGDVDINTLNGRTATGSTVNG
ncbi:MAG: hypothetical protein ACPGQF_07700, partial [Akkermansiaceae bacterium]